MQTQQGLLALSHFFAPPGNRRRARRWNCSVWIALVASVTATAAEPPLGDSQGTVAAIRVNAVTAGVKSFTVYFAQVQNDRWACLGNGTLVIQENGYGVTPETYKQMLAVAMVAQAAGKPLAVDSAGTNPCTNANSAWVVK